MIPSSSGSQPESLCTCISTPVRLLIAAATLGLLFGVPAARRSPARRVRPMTCGLRTRRLATSQRANESLMVCARAAMEQPASVRPAEFRTSRTRCGDAYWGQHGSSNGGKAWTACCAVAVPTRRNRWPSRGGSVVRPSDGTGMPRLPRQLARAHALRTVFKATGYTIGKTFWSSERVSSTCRWPSWRRRRSASIRNNNTTDPDTGDTVTVMQRQNGLVFSGGSLFLATKVNDYIGVFYPVDVRQPRDQGRRHARRSQQHRQHRHSRGVQVRPGERGRSRNGSSG